MNRPTRLRPLLVLAGFLMLIFIGVAAAEPPSRVARLSYISGTVSFSPAGQPDWVWAVVNRPLTTGDSLWADANSRAELQVGGAAIRLGALTSVTLLNLDDRIAQVQLSQGTLKLQVRRMGRGQVFEVNTPNLAVTLRRAGNYRIDVDPNGDATAVTVQSGQAEVYGEGASYTVNPQQGYRFYGSGLSDYERLAAQRDDDLDRWARERDRRSDNSPSARYVSPELVGYEDLDANGTWRADPNYGNVWMPTRVGAGWTPYRDGQWAWIDPWGWSWVDDAPWGYAVSHYGRWTNIRGAWAWVPGPPREQAVYAPALVAFIGGNSFQASLSLASTTAAAVGWFPLAPREVYRPSYPVSRGYFDNVNRSNAVIAPATITNVYNTTIVNNTRNVTQVIYVNQQVRGAVVAVPAQTFVQSQPVAKAAVRVSREAAISTPAVAVAAVAPVQQSVQGSGGDAGDRRPRRERAVVARTAPPPPPLAFAAQQQQLTAAPGTPIDAAQRQRLKPAAPAVVAPAVSVVTTAQAPAPTAPPPATPKGRKSRDERKADAANADASKAETGKTEATKGDAAKADSAKVDAAKAEVARAEAVKADAAKAATIKADAARADATKAEAAKGEAARAEAVKVDAAKADTARAEAVKADVAKAATARAEAAKADSARVEAVKADAARAATARAEAARANAAKAEAAKAEAAQTDAARAEAARAETVKADAAKADAARANAAKKEAAIADAAKADAAKAEAAKTDAARADAAKTAAAKAAAAAAAAKVEALRADTAKADAAKAAPPPSKSRARAPKPEPDAAVEDKKKTESP